MLESDEDKELAKLLTGYQDMIGLIGVHKVARFNTQVNISLLLHYVVIVYSLRSFFKLKSYSLINSISVF